MEIGDSHNNKPKHRRGKEEECSNEELMRRIEARAEEEARDLTRTTLSEYGKAIGTGVAAGVGKKYGPEFIDFIRNLFGW